MRLILSGVFSWFPPWNVAIIRWTSIACRKTWATPTKACEPGSIVYRGEAGKKLPEQKIMKFPASMKEEIFLETLPKKWAHLLQKNSVSWWQQLLTLHCNFVNYERQTGELRIRNQSFDKHRPANQVEDPLINFVLDRQTVSGQIFGTNVRIKSQKPITNLRFVRYQNGPDKKGPPVPSRPSRIRFLTCLILEGFFCRWTTNNC